MADLSNHLQEHETLFNAFLNHFEQLKYKLQTKEVATKLFKERVLTVPQFRAFTDNVKEFQIDYDINHQILNLMIDKTVAEFQKFLNIITLPSSSCRSIGDNIKQAINTTTSGGAGTRVTRIDGESIDQVLSPQLLAKWGNDLRNTFDYFAGKLARKHFMKVANKFKLDDQAVDDITHDQRGTYDQYYTLFIAWIQSKGRLATLRVFIETLSQAEMKTVIDEYCQAVQLGKISWD